MIIQKYFTNDKEVADKLGCRFERMFGLLRRVYMDYSCRPLLFREADIAYCYYTAAISDDRQSAESLGRWLDGLYEEDMMYEGHREPQPDVLSASLVWDTINLMMTYDARVDTRHWAYGVVSSHVSKAYMTRVYPLLPDSLSMDSPTDHDHKVADELRRDDVSRFLDCAVSDGILDDRWQLRGSTRQGSILADYVGNRFSIRCKWKVFGQLWGINREVLRSAFNKLTNSKDDKEFVRRLSRL